jgi:hypothetical protein
MTSRPFDSGALRVESHNDGLDFAAVIETRNIQAFFRMRVARRRENQNKNLSLSVTVPTMKIVIPFATVRKPP